MPSKQIIVNAQIVEDPWTLAAPDAPQLPDPSIPVILSREQFLGLSDAERQARQGRLGVSLGGDEKIEEILPYLSSLSVIRWVFSRFADGRGYSHARLLRDREGFKGQLRAAGDVLRDQLFYLKRCGFDAFEVREDKSLEDALLGLKDFSVTYQPAADEQPPIYAHKRPWLER
jgi:uncharacterized protein (DUF934 family)